MKISSITNLTMFAEEQTLDLSKRLTLIFGYNGSGKTSISRLLNYASRLKFENFNFENLKSLNSENELTFKITNEKEAIVQDISAVVFNKDYIDSMLKKSSFIENKINSDNIVVADISFPEKDQYFLIKNKYEEQIKLRSDLQTEMLSYLTNELQKEKSLINATNLRSFNNEKFLEQFDDIPDSFEKESEKLLRNRIEGMSKIDEESKLDEISSFNYLCVDEIIKCLELEEENLILEYLNDLTQEHQKWIIDGFQHFDKQSCPFCRTDVSKNLIVNEYRRYKDSKIAITMSILKSRKAEFELVTNKILSNISDANKSFFKYKDVIDNFDSKVKELEMLKENVVKLDKLLRDSIQLKENDNYSKIDISIEVFEILTQLKTNFELVTGSIKRINKSFINSVSETRKAKTEYLENFSFVKIKSIVKADIINLGKFDKEILDLEPLVNDSKKIYFDELIKRDSVLAAVNEIFEQIGFEKYRIDSDFRLYHKYSSKDVNFTFTNRLSDGEKSLVAFSLFYAQIKLNVFSDAEYIVIDDPVSSLDYENIYNIHTLIESLVKERSKSKFIILTHNHIFYNFLLYKRSSQKSSQRDYSLYRIQKNDSNISEIIEDKSDSINVYIDKLIRINQIYTENSYHDHEVALIPNYCRYIIESIAIFFFPNSGDPVNSLFNEIRHDNKELLSSKQSAILSKSCIDVLDKLVNVGSHAMVENVFDRERFSDQDYKTMCKGTIQIIKHYVPHQLHE